MSVPPIFERFFIQEELDKVEFYNLCDNHIKSRDVKHVPCHRLDFREKVWDVFDNLPDEDRDKATKNNDFSNLEERLWEDIHSNLESYANDGETGFEVFTDMNGYRLLCDIPIYSLFEHREEYEQNLSYIYKGIKERGFADDDDKAEIQEALDSIKGIDEELCKEGANLKRFNEIAKAYAEHNMYEDRIWLKKVKTEKDEEDEYTLIGDWELDDYLYGESYGHWKIIDTKHKDFYEAESLKNLFGGLDDGNNNCSSVQTE